MYLSSSTGFDPLEKTFLMIPALDKHDTDTILFEHSIPSFHEGSAELQIPPLRCAAVGMTKGRVVVS
jgi:hypothetical protein